MTNPVDWTDRSLDVLERFRAREVTAGPIVEGDPRIDTSLEQLLRDLAKMLEEQTKELYACDWCDTGAVFYDEITGAAIRGCIAKQCRHPDTGERWFPEVRR